MNECSVKAVPVSNGYEGHFKRVHKAAWEAVRVNGVVHLWPTELEAKLAAHEALLRTLFSDGIVGSGEKANLAITAANLIFPGKGRRIAVERRRSSIS